MPISLPDKVQVKVNGSHVTVKGPKGELSRTIDPDITVKVEDGKVELARPTDQKRHKAMHGLYRSLINNMVVGVSTGFTKKMDLIGVGYRATNTGQVLELVVGYSHPVVFMLPSEIKIATENEKGKAPRVILECSDNELLGMVSAKIRSVRKPEVYKGKGIRFEGEFVRKKAGKSASKK
jgi:large subunit ribosomal protein L6